jgi:hypothetical protein
MNAYKAEAILTEDGKLILTGLPFRDGRTVEVIVLEHETHNPIDVAIEDDREYLMGASALMIEWDSQADELAYGDL